MHRVNRLKTIDTGYIDTNHAYLGVILDDLLSFGEHIKYYNKSTTKLRILHQAREYLDQKTSVLLYKSLFVPYLNYCDATYMCGTATDLHQLQLIQNAACRTILRVPKYTGADYMHTELKLMKFAPTFNNVKTGILLSIPILILL